MAEYLTESAYGRWYKQYQLNIGRYLNMLNNLRVRVDPLLDDLNILDIQNLISEIDDHLERAIPRNFSIEGKPVMGFEKFFENIKVLINLMSRALKKSDKFLGIYYEEKDRIMKIHQEYKFKDKLNELKEKIYEFEAKKKHERRQASYDSVAASE
jgi:hypothetical protein